MIDIIKILMIDQFPFWVLVSALVLFGLSRISFSRGLYYRLNYKLFGHGSCIQCGKKRQSFWLLTCNECYYKKFPQERPINENVDHG